jgi:hypothetical protein
LMAGHQLLLTVCHPLLQIACHQLLLTACHHIHTAKAMTNKNHITDNISDIILSLSLGSLPLSLPFFKILELCVNNTVLKICGQMNQMMTGIIGQYGISLNTFVYFKYSGNQK